MKTTSIMVFNKIGQVLLQKRDNISTIKEPGKWDFWGGHCEAKESPELCAKRELKEENGLEVRIEKDLKSITVRRFNDTEEYVFAYLLESGETPPVYEGEGCKWFDIKEARRLPMAFGAEVLFEPELIKKAKGLLGI